MSTDLKPHIIIAASLLVTGILLFTASIILIIAHCKSKKMKKSQTDEESGFGNLSKKSEIISNNTRYMRKCFISKVDKYSKKFF